MSDRHREFTAPRGRGIRWGHTRSARWGRRAAPVEGAVGLEARSSGMLPRAIRWDSPSPVDEPNAMGEQQAAPFASRPPESMERGVPSVFDIEEAGKAAGPFGVSRARGASVKHEQLAPHPGGRAPPAKIEAGSATNCLPSLPRDPTPRPQRQSRSSSGGGSRDAHARRFTRKAATLGRPSTWLGPVHRRRNQKSACAAGPKVRPRTRVLTVLPGNPNRAPAIRVPPTDRTAYLRAPC